MLDALLQHFNVADSALTRDLQSEDVAWLPDNDRPVLAAAIRLRCDALVTGDRTHFGAGFGRRFGGVIVYSPRLLAEEALGQFSAQAK